MQRVNLNKSKVCRFAKSMAQNVWIYYFKHAIYANETQLVALCGRVTHIITRWGYSKPLSNANGNDVLHCITGHPAASTLFIFNFILCFLQVF